ncbi:MAG: FAD binding domain-containing protein [Sciscionella sp.]
MYPRAFDYLRPQDVSEVTAALARYGADARVLAGGMSLVPMLKYRQCSPAVLVDIGRLTGLSGIDMGEDVVSLGAVTHHHEVAAWRCREALAAVPELAARIGDAHVRNMGTVGGGLAAVEPTGDWGTLVLAMRGEVVATSTRGERTIPIDSFFVDTHRSSLEVDELLTEVRLPIPERDFGTAFAKFEARSGAALISCAGCVELAGERVTRIGLACVGVRGFPTRLAAAEELLLGRRPAAQAFEEAVAEARTECGDDFRGAVVGSLLREVLLSATRRARGEVAA